MLSRTVGMVFALVSWGLATGFSLPLRAQGLSEMICLDDNWEFSRAGHSDWREATVPGSVHQDLIRYGDLPDPFYGTNEERIQWVEEEDWEYRTSFTLSDSQLRHDAAELVFEGLDTYADIYLNGALVGSSQNMFVGQKLPVKDVLRVGQNQLYVYFYSPIRKALPQYRSNGFNYPADNDRRIEHLSVFTRKAPYSYGWDWGIRMVTSGIWLPVRLHLYDVAAVSDYFVRQVSLTDSVAHLQHELSVNQVLSYPVQVSLQIEAKLGEIVVTAQEHDVLLQPGENRLVYPMSIEKPKRWMPNGWGEPVLYTVQAKLVCRGMPVAIKKQRIGLRTLRVVNEPDQYGKSFYIEVNGLPLFAKGANYIPQDALLAAVSDERYLQLLHDVKEANMNMIRVWGGGIYERDLFYDLADELGILIWQDFQFACTPYPSNPAFLENVRKETDYQIRRLRNHPSLALWCGNNEIEEALKYWGYQRKYTPEVYAGFMEGYDRLFRCLLPHRVEALDQGRFYLHTSPAHANWGRPHTWGVGDSHNWGVWYGQKPFESLDRDSARFMSEFGFQAFPEMKTIASFASPTDYSIESEVMKAHQKSSIGNELIHKYMERDYHVPSCFEDFVYVGLVMQGKGIRRGLEAHRRMRPYCMGTLYWQLNDSWPVVSWSGIDYYGNWKALHYEARRAFAPVLVNVVEKKDSLAIYMISDRLDELSDLQLTCRVIDFYGKELQKNIRFDHISLPANTSMCLAVVPIADWVAKDQLDKSYMHLHLRDSHNRVLAESVYYFVKPKQLQLPETSVYVKQQVKEGECVFTLQASALTKDIFLEIPVQGVRFSDNFFDLLPGEQKRIIARSPHIHADEEVSYRVHHLRDTYE